MLKKQITSTQQLNFTEHKEPLKKSNECLLLQTKTFDLTKAVFSPTELRKMLVASWYVSAT